MSEVHPLKAHPHIMHIVDFFNMKIISIHFVSVSLMKEQFWKTYMSDMKMKRYM